MGIMSEIAMGNSLENTNAEPADFFDDSMLLQTISDVSEIPEIPETIQPVSLGALTKQQSPPAEVPVGAALGVPNDTEMSDKAEDPPAAPASSGPTLVAVAGGAAETSDAADETAVSEDEKKKAHEEAEAKRKAEWEAKQQAKKKAEEEQMAKVAAMSTEELQSASMDRIGKETELLTRRNMKDCVSEHIQTQCIKDGAFARLVMHPKKNMINCFRYINRHALEFIKKEAEDRGEDLCRFGVGFGEDVPDDLCYKWAEDYFRDMDCEEDKDKEEEFVPKPYRGGTTTKTTKPAKKKEPKKKPAPKKPAKQEVEGQITLGEVG